MLAGRLRLLGTVLQVSAKEPRKLLERNSRQALGGVRAESRPGRKSNDRRPAVKDVEFREAEARSRGGAAVALSSAAVYGRRIWGDRAIFVFRESRRSAVDRSGT